MISLKIFTFHKSETATYNNSKTACVLYTLIVFTPLLTPIICAQKGGKQEGHRNGVIG